MKNEFVTYNGLLLDHPQIFNYSVAVQPPIPTNKLGVEPKRPGLPVNITPQCHQSAAVPNHIHVTWTPEIGRVSGILSWRIVFYILARLGSWTIVGQYIVTGCDVVMLYQADFAVYCPKMF